MPVLLEVRDTNIRSPRSCLIESLLLSRPDFFPPSNSSDNVSVPLIMSEGFTGQYVTAVQPFLPL